MQFVGVTNQRLRLPHDLLDRRRIEFRQVADVIGIQRAAVRDRACSSFLQLAAVKKRIGIRVEQLVTKRRRLARVASDQFDSSRLDVFEHAMQAVEIHRFGQAVVHRLLNQRMIGQLVIANDVLLAAGQLGKHGRQ